MSNAVTSVQFMKAVTAALNGLGYDVSAPFEILFEPATGVDVSRDGQVYFTFSLGKFGNFSFFPRTRANGSYTRDELLDAIGLAVGSRRKLEILAKHYIRKNYGDNLTLY